MNRRSLLSMLGLAPAAALATSKIGKAKTRNIIVPENHDLKDGFLYYRGYKMWWTGWKAHEANCDLISQSVAIWKDNVHGLYVSNPGGWGPFRRGDVFDIGYRFPQVLTSISTEDDKKTIRHQMGWALHQLIDYVSDRGMQESPNTRYWRDDPLRVHPELKNYFGWMVLPEDCRRRLLEEELRNEKASRDSNPDIDWQNFRT